MNVNIPEVSKTGRGILLMIAGLVLFVHATNIIHLGLTTVIIVASIILMIYGFLKAGLYEKLVQLFSGRKHQK